MDTIPNKEGQVIKTSSKISNKVVFDVDKIFNREIVSEFIKGSGQFVILPKGKELLEGLILLLNELLKSELGFQEVVLPKIAPVSTFKQARILNKWDKYLLSVKPFSKTGGVKEEYIMDPLQCTTFYKFFENKVIDTKNGALKWCDKSGPTYRNEDLGKVISGIKQKEFHRYEFMYIGTKEQVIQIREACLNKLEQLCKELALEYRIVVGSGCYQLENGELDFPNSVDEIPIKDIEVYIPHRKIWLELAGSAALSTTITKNFNIKDINGNYLWSGCTGIGLDRFMYALISNHGVNLNFGGIKNE